MKTITLTPTKTYKTRDNAIKAVEKKLGHIEGDHFAQLRYMINIHDDGRFYPVFIGTSAIEAGVHFHFNVIA